MLRRGQVVAVQFYDHMQGGKRPVLCTAYGKVSGIAASCVVIDSWVVKGGKAMSSVNNERFCIVRSAIRSVTELVPRERQTRHIS